DLSWVAPHLAVGAAFWPVQIDELRDCGVRRVVDLRAERCDDAVLLARHNIELLHLPTPDLCALDAGVIDAGVAWVAGGLERGLATLVHCEHGIGRSASLACCVLVARGMALDEALAALKRARPRVSPSPEQLEALIRWAGRRGALPRGVELADLAAIAYRQVAA